MFPLKVTVTRFYLTIHALLHHFSSIGALNHKFFCLFLLYTAMSCIVSLLLLIMRLMHCGYVHKDHSDTPPSTTENAESATSDDRTLSTNFVFPECQDLYNHSFFLVLAVCSFVFLIFSCAMGFEQLEAIETGKGKIARMQQSLGTSGNAQFDAVTEEFNEMFGGDSPHVAWHWFFPLTVQFPRGMKQVVLGYDFNESFLPVPYQENDQNFDEAMSSSTLCDDDIKEQDALLHNVEEGEVSTASQDETRRSPYNGRRLNPLPRRRLSAGENDQDDGITLVDRMKPQLA